MGKFLQASQHRRFPNGFKSTIESVEKVIDGYIIHVAGVAPVLSDGTNLRELYANGNGDMSKWPGRSITLKADMSGRAPAIRLAPGPSTRSPLMGPPGSSDHGIAFAPTAAPKRS